MLCLAAFLGILFFPSSSLAWVNPGFETGNLAGWTTSSGSGTGLVCGPPIVNVVSTTTLQAAVPGISPDTIGPNTSAGLSMVHTGNYAAQLFSAHGDNNYADWARICQSDTVPTNGTCCLSFWIAAVLEDHHYLLGDTFGDAYIEADVIVGGGTCGSGGVTVASLRYGWGYVVGTGLLQVTGTNGQGDYPGCLITQTPYPDWGFIPWTQQTVNLCPYAGQNVTLSVTAYDCDGNGHYSLGYLDDVSWGSCPNPEFTLVKSVNPQGLVNAGDTLTYTLNYSNPSASPIDGVEICDTIPDDVKYDKDASANPPLGAITWTGTSPGDTICWDVGYVPAGGSGTLNFTAVVNKGCSVITNQAWETNAEIPGLTSNAVTNEVGGCTPSKTPTSTRTFTSTPTFSFTPSPTATSTLTFTSTSSFTPTSTGTFTPTSTFSFTPSPTATATLTFTSTSSFTATSTRTSTSTATSTFTALPTSTSTDTATAVPTATGTFTSTSTFTAIPTATRTSTGTATATDSMTATPSLTATPSASPTHTAVPPTFTFTDTHTATATPTKTMTDTATFTPTDSATATPSPTATDSFTPTNTKTPTPTATVTSTSTPTLTATQTPTSTPTWTPTNIFTPTKTFTPTLTWTPSLTPTFTDTPTNTPTSTFTFTPTPTPQVSLLKQVSAPQAEPATALTYSLSLSLSGPSTGIVVTDTLPAQMTYLGPVANNPASLPAPSYNPASNQLVWNLPPLSGGTYQLSYQAEINNLVAAGTVLTNYAVVACPGSGGVTASAKVVALGGYTVKINVYNEAGELVATLLTKQDSQPILDFSLQSNGTITQLNGEGSSVTVLFDGIPIAAWNGTTSTGTPATNGNYLVSVQNIDGSGNVTTVSQKVTVNRSYAQVAVNIYNEAGEIVRHIYAQLANAPGSTMTDVQLSSSVIRPGFTPPDPTTSVQIAIQTSTGPVSLAWDGTDDSGAVVTNGHYVIGVHWMDGEGYSQEITRTIVVEGPPRSTGIVAVPNLLNPTQGTQVTTFRANATGDQTLTASIYTIGGEWIKNVAGAPGSGEASWDATGIASGLYLAVVEVRGPNGGILDRKTLKVLVLH